MSRWNDHVKDYMNKHHTSLKNALKEAKKTYHQPSHGRKRDSRGRFLK